MFVVELDLGEGWQPLVDEPLQASATRRVRSEPGRRSPEVRRARGHRKERALHLSCGRLCGFNVPAMNRPLKTAPCCPLAGNRFDRWGYGRIRAYKAATSEGLGARAAARTLLFGEICRSQEGCGSGSIR